MQTSEGHRPPDPRGSPGISPKSGDGVGTGTGFENLRGRGGDGESGNFGDFSGINPENPRISGTGTGLHFSKCSGTGRGRGQLKASGNRARFRGFPEESPKLRLA